MSRIRASPWTRILRKMRANWMFADTINGAKASAALYSLISTARANALEPYAYLKNLFEKLPHAPPSMTSKPCYRLTPRRNLE
jgi:hypothetical protein